MSANSARPASPPEWLGWIRANLFSSWWNGLLTLAAVWLSAKALAAFVDWALLEAVWTGGAEACRAAALAAAGAGASAGACWPAISENFRFMLFGVYPFAEQWRPAVGVGLMVAVGIAAAWRIGGAGLGVRRGFWLTALAAALAAAVLLTAGGAPGLAAVPSDQWGGLPLTVLLAVSGLAGAFPLGVLLALGRQSQQPVIKAVSVAYIELIRGVPLISVLFMASVMLPLFLPPELSIDKLLRAQIGIMLFTAAYIAEVVRGGLQALPKGQFEAAAALGLSYWQSLRLVILPQALRLVIPALVNSFISTFKDTSLVVVIGVFDLLNATRTALNDPSWREYQTEGFFFAGVIFWIACYAMSKYSQHLERAASGEAAPSRVSP